MALSSSDVKEIYTWLSVGWPTVLKPGAPDEFVRMKCREIMHDFGTYDIGQIREAVDRCRRNSDKFPTSKAIMNEIKWIQAAEAAKRKAENPDDEGWPMEIIYPDGHEACYGVFNRSQFVNHAKNPEHLQPEEWRRRFMKRRQQIYKRLQEEARA